MVGCFLVLTLSQACVLVLPAGHLQAHGSRRAAWPGSVSPASEREGESDGEGFSAHRLIASRLRILRRVLMPDAHGKEVHDSTVQQCLRRLVAFLAPMLPELELQLSARLGGRWGLSLATTNKWWA